jgi:uncharacterized membrane protein YcaP (DUF421 family)
VFFDGWYPIVRVLVVGTVLYFSLIIILRVSGKRTLSKMNAFDFVITVALGSTLAAALLTEDVSLTAGLLGLALLVGLQHLLAWVSVRSGTVRRLIKSQPRLLYHRGEFLEGPMRAERVTRKEILQAARTQGLASLDDVEAVVLDTDGTLDVITGKERGDSTLSDVA